MHSGQLHEPTFSPYDTNRSTQIRLSAGIHYHSPWWPDYRELNDYYGRLSFVMSKGIQKNDILVLEPNSTLWSYYVHAGSSPKLMEIGTNFQAFVTTLEKNQVEYDLGSENIIKDLGKVENGRFIVGNAPTRLSFCLP